MKENTILNFNKNSNCEIFFDDGTSQKIYSNWLHNNDLDNWKGWECKAGVHRIYINENLEVFSGECKNDHLGNLNNKWNLLTVSICKRERCTGCTDDLLVEKQKND